jgi:hypothetical protein
LLESHAGLPVQLQQALAKFAIGFCDLESNGAQGMPNLSFGSV